VVNLEALARNYQVVRRHSSAEVSAVIKAGAYGAGIEAVVCRLMDENCGSFFAAFTHEAERARVAAPQADVYVMSPMPGIDFDALISSRLIPCLYDLTDVRQWLARCKNAGVPPRAALHFETGINRLGLPPGAAAELSKGEGDFAGLAPMLIMSHLANGDDPRSGLNARQLDRFKAVRACFPAVKASLSNSAGVFLGSEFHFDLVRPGVCLFGHDPHHHQGRRRVETVLSLQATLAQVRVLAAGDSVGYGAMFVCDAKTRTGIVLAGYADGVPRALSRRIDDHGHDKAFSIEGYPAPVLGRVSMDCTVVDLSAVPESVAVPGAVAELYGEHQSVEAVARALDTIPYELFTRIGGRVRRCYT